MTGRMKGQAFVTFPSVELAREALNTLNGYIFKEKPIVVVIFRFSMFITSALENRVRVCRHNRVYSICDFHHNPFVWRVCLHLRNIDENRETL